jgi:hypothetical protein
MDVFPGDIWQNFDETGGGAVRTVGNGNNEPLLLDNAFHPRKSQKKKGNISSLVFGVRESKMGFSLSLRS